MDTNFDLNCTCNGLIGRKKEQRKMRTEPVGHGAVYPRRPPPVRAHSAHGCQYPHSNPTRVQGFEMLWWYGRRRQAESLFMARAALRSGHLLSSSFSFFSLLLFLLFLLPLLLLFLLLLLPWVYSVVGVRHLVYLSPRFWRQVLV